jgi:hypothetical protein
MILSIKKLSVRTFGIVTLSMKTLSIRTISIMAQPVGRNLGRIFNFKGACLFAMQLPCSIPSNSYWKGRLSTVDLLVKKACFI